jgi:triacylglycerol lipase
MTGAPPLVLVHGLWDTPRLFDPLKRELANRRSPLLIPHLPHGLGVTPLDQLAGRLGAEIEARFGPETTIDLFGFSMGGVIGRTWLQLLGGHRRTRRFISVASPHRGTLTALPWPRRLLAGVADMKPGSPLLRRLNHDLAPLRAIDCCSFYTPCDLTVLPAAWGVLPVGRVRALPWCRHDRVMADPGTLAELVAEILRA